MIITEIRTLINWYSLIFTKGLDLAHRKFSKFHFTFVTYVTECNMRSDDQRRYASRLNAREHLSRDIPWHTYIGAQLALSCNATDRAEFIS